MRATVDKGKCGAGRAPADAGDPTAAIGGLVGCIGCCVASGCRAIDSACESLIARPGFTRVRDDGRVFARAQSQVGRKQSQSAPMRATVLDALADVRPILNLTMAADATRENTF